MKHLFIGGSRDGHRIEATESGYRCAVRSDRSGEWSYETYWIRIIRGEVGEHVVYALDGMSVDEVVSRLIDGYSAKKNEK